jgi:hypothetical protein
VEAEKREAFNNHAVEAGEALSKARGVYNIKKFLHVNFLSLKSARIENTDFQPGVS